MRSTIVLAAVFVLAVSHAGAQTHLGDGDDLVAAVAAAVDGEILFLDSNLPFEGTLSWAGKEILLIAGVGYEPTIRGDAGSPAVELDSSTPVTTGYFQGIRLAPGFSGPGSQSGPAVRLGGTGTGSEIAELTLVDCTLGAGVSMSGTGVSTRYLNVSGTHVAGDLTIASTGSAGDAVDIDGDSRWRGALVRPTGDTLTIIELEETTWLEPFEIDALSTSEVIALALRSRFEGGMTVDAISTATSEATVESCLFTGDGDGTGILVRQPASFLGSSFTVTGFETGIDSDSSLSVDGALLANNDDDLSSTVLAGQVRYSLIEDGTLEGLNGNIGGSPKLDGNFALLPGSLGIDSGDPGNPFYSSLDLAGDPRVQDSDGDGLAQTNVGALESIAPCPQAAFTPFNGSGVNPNWYGVLQTPVQGASFVGEVQLGPTTVATVLAIGVQAEGPTILPGFEGEFLLDLAIAPFLDVSTGIHVIPIPEDIALCGVEVDSQALRIDLPAGSQALRFTNGARLLLGD